MRALAEVGRGRGVILVHENEKDIYGDTPALPRHHRVGGLRRTCGWPGTRPTSSRSECARSPRDTPRCAPPRVVQIKDACWPTGRCGRGRRRATAARRDHSRAARGRLRRLLLARAAPRDVHALGASRARAVHPVPGGLHRPLAHEGSSTHEHHRRPMTTRTARVPLVGAGVIGKHHGQVISSSWPTRSSWSRSSTSTRPRPEAGRRTRRPALRSLTDALAAEDIDVIVVCTPTGGTATWPSRRWRPASTSSSRSRLRTGGEDRSRSSRRNEGRDAGGGHLAAPFRPGHRGPAGRDRARASWAGSPPAWPPSTGGAAAYYDSGDWRGTWELDGGGALMNQGVHTVDLLVAAMGRPVEVFAYTGAVAHERIEIEDVARRREVRERRPRRHPRDDRRVPRPERARPRARRPRLGRHRQRPAVLRHRRRGGWRRRPRQPPRPVPRRRRPLGGAGSDPGQLLRRAPAPVPQHPRCTGGTREARVDLDTNRRSIAVITGAYESARTGSRWSCRERPAHRREPDPLLGQGRKSREVFDQAFRDFSDIGYTAVKADIPEGMSATEYLEWIGGYGLAPALSLLARRSTRRSTQRRSLESVNGSPTTRRRSAWTVRWCRRWRCRLGWRAQRWVQTSTRTD